MVINLYKPLGKTPLEAIGMLKKKYPQYADIKMGYAGRLDPLAEGVLLVLGEDTLKEQKKYMELDKEYEAEILFGVETDTYDVLGMPVTVQSSVNAFSDRGRLSPAESRRCALSGKSAKGRTKLFRFRELLESHSRNSVHRISKSEQLKGLLKKELKKFKGRYKFSLPPYSSYRIQGKPLFWWARRRRLDEIEIPKKTVKIYDIELLGVRELSLEDIKKRATERVDMVKGDFRQEKIKAAWQGLSSTMIGERTLPVARVRISCSSGTYVRSIADDLGKRFGTGAVLIGLKRTRVGEDYKIEDSIQVST